jgi:formiminoglutamate deiminase
MYAINVIMSIHNNPPTAAIFARHCLLPTGWQADVRIETVGGKISAVFGAAEAQEGDVGVDCLLPALSNLHSHSFQRGMAGMTEMRGPGADSFWTWRDLMYRFVGVLSPDDIEAIAAQAFMEMQEAGYAAVAEFHYLHNDQGGAAYDDPAELSTRVMSAASLTGIGLTHLPVLYCFGGAGEKPLATSQLRFGKSLDQFAKLASGIASAMARDLSADCRMGVAPHSLRAVSPDILVNAAKIFSGLPFHIHIAEQVREVEEVVSWLKARPVEWLLNSLPLDDRWCLIHATHMTEVETQTAAKSGAVAGLCPITEANLGDGIFNGAEYFAAGGSFGVGTDSNVSISANGELRMLEYSQRLKLRVRNAMAVVEGSTGEQLYKAALKGGARALGRKSGEIVIGQWADLVALDGQSDHLCGLQPKQVVDGFVFASDHAAVTDLWSAGRHCVRHGRHVEREAVSARFRAVMARLAARL